MLLFLASKSKRRIELLKNLGLDFIVIEPNVDESIIVADPEKTVITNAMKKVFSVLDKVPLGSVIMGVDTIVVVEGEILGKPKSLNQNIEMLRKLNGRWHLVYSGVFIVKKGENLTDSFIVKTAVKFGELSEKELLEYASTMEGMDKAGGYAAQGLGAVLIERIEGDFYNILGLPIFSLVRSLSKFGIEVL